MFSISPRHPVRLTIVYPAAIWLVAGCCGGSGLAAPADVQDVTVQKRGGPYNVLFLMTDEQHYRSLSSTGNRYITTPNMDRIGREGARFENATCVTPYCSPSRASIITGVYPHTHHILLNVDKIRSPQAPLSQASLSQDAFPTRRRSCIGWVMPPNIAASGTWPLSAISLPAIRAISPVTSHGPTWARRMRSTGGSSTSGCPRTSLPDSKARGSTWIGRSR